MATPRNRSVKKAFTLLQAFRSADESLTSAELSRRAGLPEASGYRLIQTLEDLGAVVRGAKGRYRPGMLLVSLSHNVAVGELLPQASQAIMQNLAAELALTVHMGVFDGGMVTYIAKVRGPSSSFPVHTQVGSQLEAYCSGLGKVLLAALPADELQAFIADGEFVALTPHTIIDPEHFRREIAGVRAQVYAMDDREISENMRCMAVPIHDGDGAVVAALSVTDAADVMVGERQGHVRAALMGAATAISRKVFPAQPQIS